MGHHLRRTYIMVSQKERRRLVEYYERDSLEVSATRLKCAVCIVFIVGIAAMGYRADTASREADGSLAQRLSSVAGGPHADYVHEPNPAEQGP
jgi:hypothetical protein